VVSSVDGLVAAFDVDAAGMSRDDARGGPVSRAPDGDDVIESRDTMSAA